jgi:polyhydroxyalkanoate synthesis regulator phasin
MLTPTKKVADALHYYEQGNQRWFSRTINQLSDAEKDDLKHRLKVNTLDPQKLIGDRDTVQEVSTDVRVRWTDEEWDRLAELVWRGRKKDPAESIIVLVEKAQSQFPVDRRRKVNSKNLLGPMFERLTKLDERIENVSPGRVQELESQIHRLQEQLKTSTRHNVIANLTDHEVGVHFADRLLNDILTPDEVLNAYAPETLLSYVSDNELLAHAVKRGIELWQDRSNQFHHTIAELLKPHKKEEPKSHDQRHQHHPKKDEPKLPRVTVVGLLSDQIHELEKRFKDVAKIHGVDKNRAADAFPQNQDVIILACNFITHGLQEQAQKHIKGTKTRLILAHGGMTTIIKKINEGIGHV